MACFWGFKILFFKIINARLGINWEVIISYFDYCPERVKSIQESLTQKKNWHLHRLFVQNICFLPEEK